MIRGWRGMLAFFTLGYAVSLLGTMLGPRLELEGAGLLIPGIAGGALLSTPCLYGVAVRWMLASAWVALWSVWHVARLGVEDIVSWDYLMGAVLWLVALQLLRHGWKCRTP